MNLSVYNKDSFSHRFCDDLAKYILQWLTIYDKIQHQCVSKQFLRCLQTLCDQQNALDINGKNENSRIYSLNTEYEVVVNTKYLSNILNVFKNISKIYLN